MLVYFMEASRRLEILLSPWAVTSCVLVHTNEDANIEEKEAKAPLHRWYLSQSFASFRGEGGAEPVHLPEDRNYLNPLKGYCHKFENSYNDIQVIDLKNLGLPEHIFIPFWFHFHVLILKRHAVAVFHLTVTLQMMSNSRRSLCEWWVTAGDHSANDE